MDVSNNSQQKSSSPIKKVTVHPLVLLSIVDHYNRVSQEPFIRVVGVLLGTSFEGTVDVSNSYAVPFDEEIADSSSWFLDHDYVEAMFSMFRKINAKEHIVGWYSTGPTLRKNDLDIHRLFHKYVPNPVLVVVDVQAMEVGIPTEAYCDVEGEKQNATQKGQKVFVNVPSELAANEAEEIGVEYFLRHVMKSTTVNTLETEVSDKRTALQSLEARLTHLTCYLVGLLIFELHPSNQEALYHLQDIFNHSLNVHELTKAVVVKTNDMMSLIFLGSLIRTVIALHNLINKKIQYKDHDME